jgi:hypothetical protein
MLNRLGDVLYWTGCTFALGWIAILFVVEMNESHFRWFHFLYFRDHPEWAIAYLSRSSLTRSVALVGTFLLGNNSSAGMPAGQKVCLTGRRTGSYSPLSSCGDSTSSILILRLRRRLRWTTACVRSFNGRPSSAGISCSSIPPMPCADVASRVCARRRLSSALCFACHRR